MPTTFDPADLVSLTMLRKTAPARHKPFQHYIEVKIMPTGYTDKVATGDITTLEDFALKCARAFGACIDQKDSPLAEPAPKKVEPATAYYDQVLAGLRQELARLDIMTEDQAEVAAYNNWKELCAALHQRAEERQAQAERYREMRGQVEAWAPPEPLHGLKAFMLQQLTISLEHDCSPLFDEDEPERLAGPQWRGKRMKEISEDIGRYTRRREDEIKRAADATEWLQLLRKALASAS